MQLSVYGMYNVILFSNKKEQNTDTCYKKDEVQSIMLSERNQTQRSHIVQIPFNQKR